jgi:hypothetical protein
VSGGCMRCVPRPDRADEQPRTVQDASVPS